MNIFKKINTATRLFRVRFGQFKGTLVWLQLLKEKFLPQNTLFTVRVPSYRYPIYLRSSTSDIDVFCQIFCHAELDYDFLGIPRYIIDAGANIGLTSVFLANRYPEATIDAIEISKANIEVLKLNTSNYPGVNIVAKGLWWNDAILQIKNKDAEAWAFIVEEANIETIDTFPSISISSLIASSEFDHIDILKIDIEGAEADIFNQNRATWLSNVDYLLIELHENLRPGVTDILNSAIQKFPHTRSISGEYHIIKFSR